MLPELMDTINSKYCKAVVKKHNPDALRFEIYLEGTNRMIQKGEAWFKKKNEKERDKNYEEIKRKKSLYTFLQLNFVTWDKPLPIFVSYICPTIHYAK